MTEVNDFVQLCQEEAEMVGRLVQVLEEEQQALIQGHVDLLEPLADAKSKVLDQLAVVAESRAVLMQEHGVQDSDTVYIWLADKPEASQAWTQLEEMLQRAQSINQLNGCFIEQRLNGVEQTLSFLRHTAASTLGYSRNGQQPVAVTGRRLLGSA